MKSNMGGVRDEKEQALKTLNRESEAERIR
jgi:hypothetical protein